ncbi:MAG: proline--tRNA ligase [Candidatus Sumerlaeia bacterium]|nr:proline--tRNA ligase [Candidatus Sumerlaeia bacterium]
MARESADVRKITPKSQDFAEWYVEVVRRADLADYTEIKGCMVIKPYGYGLWENLRDALDRRIKATGHRNAYFPLFVPESLLQKEADHVEGFAPEVAWVTHGGSEPLEERLAIRPTSEAVICSIYAKWVQSYRDLPVLINQWANVVRWEKRTRLFLRTSEFLWQEGHTCHRTHDEARGEVMKMLEVYREFLETELAIPAIPGRKTASERFPGAEDTFTVEALMGNGWALQAGTSHDLGQHFAKVFGIKFLDEDQAEKFVWQTSWGVSTRLVGGVVMTHGDDQGLILPPRIAPVQAILVPIFNDKNRDEVLPKARAIQRDLAAVARVEIDDRDGFKPGWKYNDWEMRGVPLRIEVGPRDLEAGQAVLARRDTGAKETVSLGAVKSELPGRLEALQRALLDRARAFRDENTRPAKTLAEAGEILENQRGFVATGWDGSPETEARIKEETKATIRCIPLDGGDPEPGMTDVVSGKPAQHRVLLARAF